MFPFIILNKYNYKLFIGRSKKKREKEKEKERERKNY